MNRRPYYIAFLLCLVVIAAGLVPLTAIAAEKGNKWLLVTVMISPVPGYSIEVTDSEADCWAQGKAFLDWGDKGGAAVGISCKEIIPGSKPEGLIKDKDGEPKQLKKDRDS